MCSCSIKNTGNIENIWPISDLKNLVKDVDRKTGRLLERAELTMNKETLICPSTFGAGSWNSGAYNPKTSGTTTCSSSAAISSRSSKRLIRRTSAPATAARTFGRPDSCSLLADIRAHRLIAREPASRHDNELPRPRRSPSV